MLVSLFIWGLTAYRFNGNSEVNTWFTFRDLDEIPAEELETAIVRLFEESPSYGEDDLITHIGSIFGLRLMTEKRKTFISNSIGRLVSAKVLTKIGAYQLGIGSKDFREYLNLSNSSPTGSPDSEEEPKDFPPKPSDDSSDQAGTPPNEEVMPENQGESVKSPIPDTEKRKNQAQATQLLLNSFDDDSEDEVWDALVNVETSLREQNKGQADSAHSRDVDDSTRNTSIIAGWEMTDHSILFHYKKPVKTKRSLPEEIDYFFPVVGGEENDSEAILFYIGDEILASLVRRNKAGRLTLNKFRTILEMADAVIGNRVSFREIKPSTYQVLIVN